MLVAVLIATYYECSKHINVQECLKLQQDCKNQYFLKIRLYGIANATLPYPLLSQGTYNFIAYNSHFKKLHRFHIANIVYISP
jgi:hypothetical protein